MMKAVDVVAGTVWMLCIWVRIECREDGITEASIVWILDIDDWILRAKELRELLIAATHQRKVFLGLLIHS